jgi:hydrogenase expression/formation protein HypC
MCLGVPGRVMTMEEDSPGLVMGRVSFGGIIKEVCMAYVPEVKVGDYVVVHVGFAITVVDEAEARRTLEFLREMDELGELEIEQPGS